jgi:hypothetical protein
MQCIT